MIKRDMKRILVGTVSAIALAGSAFAQNHSSSNENTDQLETVTVTGSRIITNGNDAPTPLTVVSIADLELTTPSDVPDALNKLPVFMGSRSQRTTGGANLNWAGNFLNLRNFGSTRNLILFNGNRVATTDHAGNTDVNTLPSDLMERVDVVTGGASAVYGTDAITGVINFVINPKYNGFKISAQGGVSSYGDDASWKVAMAGGTDLFGGRGHVEFSFNHFNSDGISTMMSRPNASEMYTMPGNGTAANPYHLIKDSRLPNYTPGGYISTGVLANKYFCTNGTLCPFAHGGASGTSNDEIGGDGGYAVRPRRASTPILGWWRASRAHSCSVASTTI